jgi:hypothetical protein
MFKANTGICDSNVVKNKTLEIANPGTISGERKLFDLVAVLPLVQADAGQVQLLRPMAGHKVVGAYLFQERQFGFAAVNGVGAARVKIAAGGRIGRAGDIAL